MSHENEEKVDVKQLYKRKILYPRLDFHEILREVDELMKHVISWKPYQYSNRSVRFSSQEFIDKVAKIHRKKKRKK